MIWNLVLMDEAAHQDLDFKISSRLENPRRDQRASSHNFRKVVSIQACLSRVEHTSFDASEDLFLVGSECSRQGI